MDMDFLSNINFVMELDDFSIAELSAPPPPPHPSFYNTTSTSSSSPFLSSPAFPKANHSAMAMREMTYRIAAMQPVHVDPEAMKPPKRRNVRMSTDPQSVAARHRRERISERIRILQRLVPGGTKMDTASMLDEAIEYVKFLQTQVQSLEMAAGFAGGWSHGHQYFIDPSHYMMS